MSLVPEKGPSARPSGDWLGLSETLVLQIAAAGLLFGMHLVAARLLPVETYGALTFGLTIAGLVTLVCSLGYPNLVLRQVSAAVEGHQWGLLKGITLQAGTAVAWTSALACLVLAAFAALRWAGNPSQALGLGIAAAAAAFYPLGFLRAKLARGLGSIRCSIVPEDVLRPLSFILLLWLAIPVLGLQLSGAGLLAAFVLSLFAAAAGGLYCLRSHVPFSWRSTNPEHKPVAWRAASRRMLAGGVFQEVLARSDLIALGLLVSMSAAAEYSAASKLALLNVFVLKVIDTYYAPRMAVAHQAGDRPGLRKVVARTALLSLVGATPVAVGLIAMPTTFLSFFGAAYTGAALPLQILAVGTLINAATGSVGYALLMTNNEGSFARVAAVVAVGNVLAHLIFTPTFGIVAAALVTACSVAMQNLLMVGVAYQRIFRDG